MISLRLMLLLKHVRALRVSLTYERGYRRREDDAVRLFAAIVEAEGALNSALMAAGRARV